MSCREAVLLALSSDDDARRFGTSSVKMISNLVRIVPGRESRKSLLHPVIERRLTPRADKAQSADLMSAWSVVKFIHQYWIHPERKKKNFVTVIKLRQ